MVTKTAAELAAQDPRLKAMLMELGSARLDDFPMEDGESGKRDRDHRTYSQPPNLSGGTPDVIRKVPIKSAWAKAMQRGDFDDEDAAQVSGMDSIADGHLARARRNQAATDTAVHSPIGNSKSKLRRDRNGHVPPHAMAGNFSKRQVPGPIHVGDGPIDIESTLSGTNVSRRRRPVRGPAVPRGMLGRGALAGGKSSQPSARAQPAVAKPRVQTTQGPRLNAQSNVRTDLPIGASVVLELPAALAAAAFPKTSPRYRGKVYLTSGSQTSEDSIIFAVEDKNIPEIRQLLTRYDTYMSVSRTGLMLKFNDSKNGFSFYGVEFENASNMNSFVIAFQGLVERPEQQSQGALAPSKFKKMTTGNAPTPSTLTDEPSQPVLVVSTQNTKPAATTLSKVSVDVGKESSATVRQQRQYLGATTPGWADLLAKRQWEIAYALKHNETVPERTENLSSSAEAVPKEIPVAGDQTSSSSPVTAVLHPFGSSSAASSAPMSKREKPGPLATSAAYAEPSVTTPVEVQTLQATSIPVQQALAQYCISPETVKDTIEWAWYTARYMQHNAPEQFGLDTLRTVIGASCAAAMGRASPSFRQLSSVEQSKLIRDHVQPLVENGVLQKLAWNETVATECDNTGLDQIRVSAQLPTTQDNSEAQAFVPSKLSWPVYEIKELMSMRSAAAVIDTGMLPEIPRPSRKAGIPQPIPGLVRVPVEVQVKQAAGTSSEWLAKRETVQDVISKVEALANFLSPSLGRRAGSPPVGLEGSIHNRDDAQLPGQETSQLTSGFENKSVYQKDLEGLNAKEVDTGNAFNHQAVEATEGIGRLSLK